MTNNFEEIYQACKALDKALDEDVVENADVAATFYRALAAYICEKGSTFSAIYLQYKESRDNGNENLDFNDYIFEAKEYADCLKKNGVKCFTISNHYVRLSPLAMELQKAGYKMTGLKEVKCRINPWCREREILPALVFEISR
nr:MAG TPA: hypothetical protein [Caudoviricetes sp.]